MDTDAREPLDPGDDPRVGDALASIAQALSVPPDEVTAQRHRRAIARARQVQPSVVARRSAATGVAAAVLVGALAVGGALPGSVQDAVADLASRVGIDLPRSTTDSEVPPPLPAARDDEPTEAETSPDGDGSADLGDRDGTSRDRTHDLAPAPERRPGSTDDGSDGSDGSARSEAPTTEAEDRVPSDPPADAPGTDTPRPAPAPAPTTPSDDPPPTTRPSPPEAPSPPAGRGDASSEQDDAAPPRSDEDDRDGPREDGRATGTDDGRPGPSHPA
jgi:hypothetical protein